MGDPEVLDTGQETEQMETAAILERLRGIESSLVRIEEHRLTDIQEHLRILNGRVGACEKWQAGTDQMIDSINERIAENADRAEKHESRITAIWEWVNQQKGWSGGRAQMVVQIGMIIATVATLVTLLTKIH